MQAGLESQEEYAFLMSTGLCISPKKINFHYTMYLTLGKRRPAISWVKS